MRIHDKTLFLAGGFVAHALAIGLFVVLAAMLIRGGSHSALPVIIIVVGIYLAGWVALIPGRRLNCESCGQPLLNSERFGFRGLAIGPLLRTAKGHQICDACNRAGHL